MIDVLVNGVNVKFRVDTGAEVTVIPNDVFKLFTNVKLLPSPQILTGPESNCLNVSEKFNAKLKTEDYCADQDIYVVKELTQSLLGWPAICALHVFANINPIFESAESVKSLFPEVFSG